jgi:hypothetical protein
VVEPERAEDGREALEDAPPAPVDDALRLAGPAGCCVVGGAGSCGGVGGESYAAAAASEANCSAVTDIDSAKPALLPLAFRAAASDPSTTAFARAMDAAARSSSAALRLNRGQGQTTYEREVYINTCKQTTLC